jgi:hypothetical protein
VAAHLPAVPGGRDRQGRRVPFVRSGIPGLRAALGDSCGTPSARRRARSLMRLRPIHPVTGRRPVANTRAWEAARNR